MVREALTTVLLGRKSLRGAVYGTGDETACRLTECARRCDLQWDAIGAAHASVLYHTGLWSCPAFERICYLLSNSLLGSRR